MSKYLEDLQGWANTVEMCENSGIDYKKQYRYKRDDFIQTFPAQNNQPNHLGSVDFEYIFPVTILKGKCLYIGDKVWYENEKLTVCSNKYACSEVNVPINVPLSKCTIEKTKPKCWLDSEEFHEIFVSPLIREHVKNLIRANKDKIL